MKTEVMYLPEAISDIQKIEWLLIRAAILVI